MKSRQIICKNGTSNENEKLARFRQHEILIKKYFSLKAGGLYFCSILDPKSYKTINPVKLQKISENNML